MAQSSATVLGGMFPANGQSTLTSYGKGYGRHVIAEMFNKKSLLDERALITTLLGVVAGSTATKALGRIENNTELGGKRVVESESLVNRATVAGDVTTLTADLLTLTTRTTLGSSPKANGDGNPLGYR
jgi:hypothetical protein